MYFKLKDIDYKITDSSVQLIYEDNEIRMYIEVNAETDDENVEYDMRQVYLYHNNGFSTGVENSKQLENMKFVWNASENEAGEEAGTCCVQEHEEITKGSIEVLKVTKKDITIRWRGFANVFWNDEYGADVPFDTEFTAKLPRERNYSVNALDTTKMKIGKDAELELLNFDEVDAVRKRVDETREWTDFNATLKFRVTYKGTDYFGEVIYTNGKINHETHFDPSCPINVRHVSMDWSNVLKYVTFTFVVSS